MSARLSVSCVIKLKERKEFKEIKERKEFRKEFKEFKEFKEKERKEIKEFKEKDKDAEKPEEFQGGDFGQTFPEQAAYGAGDIEARVMALEARLAAIEPFIDASLRPDLSQSALASEEDVQKSRPQRPSQRGRAKKKKATTRKS
jgi:hypothetical protein